MNEKEIELATRIKQILNDAGYNVNAFSFYDEHIGNREYVSAINLHARKTKIGDS